jgi:outer membrane receptor protein involved in Fe transport
MALAFRKSAVALTVATLFSQAQGQTQPPESSPIELNTVVVTGRASSATQLKAETSYSITTISNERLRFTAPTSVADVFKNVPGFWVEGSGGEASNNVRARGIPLDGYSAVSLQENGLPIQTDGGLGYLNADQSFRFDSTIERVEAVRGGPASIFAPFAPGGTVNFITKKGGAGTGSAIKVTLGDFGSQRFDAYYGDSLGNWRFLVGGFYRSENGIRDTGFRANEGGQIRVSMGRDFDRGSIDFDFKHIDDKVAFYLPIPLTFDKQGTVVPVAGFNPNYGTVAGPENAYVWIKNVGSPYAFDLTEGTNVRLSQLTNTVRLDLGSGWQLLNSARYRNSDTLRNGLFPTGNTQTIGAQLASVKASALAAFPGAVDVLARYATSPSVPYTASTGNGLVLGGNLLSVSVPLREFNNDLRFTTEMDLGGTKHALAVGTYFSSYRYRFDRYMGTTLLEAANNARRLDIVAVNAAGSPVGSVTDNGFLRYGSLYDNVGMQVQDQAFYFGDEIQLSKKLRIDLGARWEQTRISGSVMDKKTVDLGDTTTLADNQVITGTGKTTSVSKSFNGTGWTLGGNYQVTPLQGYFARVTSTFKLPSAGEYNGSPTRTDQYVVPVKMAELGAKYADKQWSAFATAFFTRFEGVTFTDNIFNPATNSFTQQFARANTETSGLEAEVQYKFSSWLDLSLTTTLQNPEYKGFKYTELVAGKPVERDFNGKQLIRVPKTAVKLVPGLNLADGAIRAELEYEHYSERYADVANSQKLPAFSVLNLNVRAKLSDNATLTLNGTNLTNEIGLTEGDPRVGQFISGDAGAQYFRARPIMGRAFRASLNYRF